MSEWLPGFGIVASPSLLVFNPNSISSWDMELGLRQTSNSPEFIKLK